MIKKKSSQPRTSKVAAPKKKTYRKKTNQPTQKQAGNRKYTSKKKTATLKKSGGYKKKKYNFRRTKLNKANKDSLRIIPLGGCEEVGRNMTVFEYKNDIIILDMGLQFPEEDMPGIDYIIPNIDYLKGKEKRIRGGYLRI